MNMFKKLKADSIKSYIESIDDKTRKDQIMVLDELIKKTVPQLKPHFAYNMLGYGTFKYVNYKKETIDWPTIAMASQKNYISIYVCSLANGKYLAETYKEKLGKVSVGKSCIRFKKVDDINLDILKEILIKAAKNPGLR